MMFKTHELAAVVATTAIIPTLNNINLVDSTNVLAVGLVFAGAILSAPVPDIDSPNSKIRRLIKKILTGDPTPKKNIPNHRREPHMPFVWMAIFAGLLSVVHGQYSLYFLYGTMIGVFSHLFIDLFNPAGLPLLPFCKIRISIPLIKIKANSFGEKVFSLCLIALEVYIIFVAKFPVINLL